MKLKSKSTRSAIEIFKNTFLKRVFISIDWLLKKDKYNCSISLKIIVLPPVHF